MFTLLIISIKLVNAKESVIARSAQLEPEPTVLERLDEVPEMTPSEVLLAPDEEVVGTALPPIEDQKNRDIHHVDELG